MIVDRSKGLDCMGDAAFVNALESGDIPTLGAMRADIERLATDRQHGRKRLEAIPGALIPLLALLDPAYRYFPAEVRAAAAEVIRCPFGLMCRASVIRTNARCSAGRRLGPGHSRPRTTHIERAITTRPSDGPPASLSLWHDLDG